MRPAFPAPTFGQLIHKPLAAFQAVLMIAYAVHVGRLIDRLPASIPLQFGYDGRPTRYGSPTELWLLVGVMFFVTLVLTSIIAGFAKERWILPDGATARHAELLAARRKVTALFVQGLGLAVTLFMGGIGIGVLRAVAQGADRGAAAGPAWLFATIGVFLGLLVAGIVVTHVRLRAIGRELKAMGGSFTYGMLESGWKLGGTIYYAPGDPELIVPKRGGFGQTFNFARPSAWIILGGVLLMPALAIAGVLNACLR
jgi:uncharacterized membrane protein